jgi:hypothetical protein
MKKDLFLAAIAIVSWSMTIGQSHPSFTERYLYIIGRAQYFDAEKSYNASAKAYDSAFRESGGHGRPADFYDAACSWALAGNPDNAFFYLDKAAREGKWSEPDYAGKDKDLLSLHADKRWQNILDRMRLNQLEKGNKIDKALEDTLNNVYTDDQSSRRAIDSIEQRFGRDSRQMDSLWEVMSLKDSADLVIVTDILRRRGWQGPDEVGGRASMALFLVIQHSDSLTQVTYLPMMRTAVQEGKARGEDLALLEDRILTEQGKPQIYGSQVRTDPSGKSSFFPILDEPNVNKRRAWIGLGPIEEYARFFQIDYHLPVQPAVSTPH